MKIVLLTGDLRGEQLTPIVHINTRVRLIASKCAMDQVETIEKQQYLRKRRRHDAGITRR